MRLSLHNESYAPLARSPLTVVCCKLLTPQDIEIWRFVDKWWSRTFGRMWISLVGFCRSCWYMLGTIRGTRGEGLPAAARRLGLRLVPLSPMLSLICLVPYTKRGLHGNGEEGFFSCA